MNIPSYALFELGFGYKYQYLISTLLHAIITDNIDFRLSEKYLRKHILNSSIHADPKKFIKQIKKILPDINELQYNKNTMMMVEGEHGCFEDINLFTTNNSLSLIRFIQVKGSMSNSSQSILNNAVISTLINSIENENTHLPFQLIILLNKNVTTHFFANSIDDKVKIIVSVIKTMKFIKKLKKDNKSLYTDFLNILENYVKELYSISSDRSLHIYLFFNLENQYKFTIYKKIIFENSLASQIHSLKHIIDKTKVIENIDYRLVYIFLKNHYGNDKLTKILWNIEMKSMNGKSRDIKYIRNELSNISFNKDYIAKIKFSKKLTKNKFKIGKIL